MVLSKRETSILEDRRVVRRSCWVFCFFSKVWMIVLSSSVVFSVSPMDFLMIPLEVKSVIMPAPATAKEPIQRGGKNNLNLRLNKLQKCLC